MFKRAIGPPTAEQQERQDKCRAKGCIACRMDGDDSDGESFLVAFQPTIHHLTVSGRTIDQDHTVCLCRWHHLGQCAPLHTSSAMRICFGPSLAKGSKTFHARYGSNDELLAYQNNLIGWTKPPQRRSRQRKRGSDKILPRKL